ncbi:hypothetical protein HK102_014117 [Quaeritorhiza haematococci]|nr:hypothetical protein HK102_014117 [Quaeritorhiza haematococci]
MHIVPTLSSVPNRLALGQRIKANHAGLVGDGFAFDFAGGGFQVFGFGVGIGNAGELEQRQRVDLVLKGLRRSSPAGS